MHECDSQDLILRLDQVRKSFGEEVAVAGVSLDIRRGEFVTLLGPSGCGKSTILRMIAGFEHPTSGRIVMNGKSLEGMMPYDRNVGLVFQNLALFPHMTVHQNIAFGLNARRTPREECAERVEEMLSLVGLAGYGKRRITELSGGQRQRIALARSLVIKPSILLLDEPLSALDLKMRRQLQDELKQIQQKTGTTFLFVTHDQEEALSMSDRIAVMNKGLVEQFSSPVDIYHHPQTAFVATFVGDTNLLPGTIESVGDGYAEVHILAGRMKIGVRLNDGSRPTKGSAIALNIRPERIVTGDRAAGAPVNMQGIVLSSTFSGPNVSYSLNVDGHSFSVLTRFSAESGGFIPVGSRLVFGWWPDSATMVPIQI